MDSGAQLQLSASANADSSLISALGTLVRITNRAETQHSRRQSDRWQSDRRQSDRANDDVMLAFDDSHRSHSMGQSSAPSTLATAVPIGEAYPMSEVPMCDALGAMLDTSGRVLAGAEIDDEPARVLAASAEFQNVAWGWGLVRC